jgi:hypothetical protein
MGGATAGVRNNPEDRAKPPMTTELGLLSPELALVDPELAERARHALRLAAQAAPRTPPVEVPPNTELPLRPPRWHRRLTLAAAALAVPSIILNVALLRDTAPVVELRAAVPIGGVAAASTTIVDTALRPDAAARRRPAASRAAKPARAVAAHRVLRWKKLPAARLYDVVIWRDGRRVRDVWTRARGLVHAEVPPTRELAEAFAAGRGVNRVHEPEVRALCELCSRGGTCD